MSSKAPNPAFGEILTEGIQSIKARQHRTIQGIQEDIAGQLGFSPASVERWRKGHVPADESHVEFLARYIVENGRRGRAWLNRFLAQARYFDRQGLMDELCPEHSSPKRSRNPICHDMPSRSGEFLGREQEMAELLEIIADPRWPLISLEGMGGIGKTTLAGEVAHRCLPGPDEALSQPFEAVVWVSAKDRPEQKQWLNEVLDAAARILDCPYITQLAAEQKPQEVRTLLQTRRVLLIVDNFETIEDPDLVQWLLRLPEPSKVLITTRHAHFRRTWPIHLQGLQETEAVEFIRRHARRLNLATIARAEEGPLRPLARVTEGNPKAMEMALGYVKSGRLSLAEVVDHLHVASKTVVDIFAYLFDWAWGALSKEAIHALLVVPFFASTFSREALGATAGLGDYDLDQALGQLVELSLLDVDDNSSLTSTRYNAHPLVRAFANVKLQAVSEWAGDARERWVNWYVKLVKRYGGEDWDNCTDFQLLKRERENIMGVAEWLYEKGSLEQLCHIANGSRVELSIDGFWKERRSLFNWTLALARIKGEKEIVAQSLRAIAWTLFLTHDLHEAESALREAAHLAGELDDLRLIIRSLVVLGYVEEYKQFDQPIQDYSVAERLNTEAAKLFSTLQVKDRADERLLIEILDQQGWFASTQKQIERVRYPTPPRGAKNDCRYNRKPKERSD